MNARWLPQASLLTAMLLWASSFIALKLAIGDFDPMVVIFGRMAVASLCFALLLRRYRGVRWRARDVRWVLFMALCEPCLYFVFEARAIQQTTASQAGMVTSVLPLMVAVAARVLLKETLSRQTLAGFGVAIAGVCWLSAGAQSTEGAPNPALGNLLEFLAMVCATGHIITLKKLTDRYPPLLLTGVQTFVGALFFTPFLLLPGTTFPQRFDLVPSLAVVYLGLAVTLGAYGLYSYGVSRIPANQATAFVNLIPAMTTLLGWAVLGERFTPAQYGACAVIFVGVVMSQWTVLRAKPDRVAMAKAEA